MKGKGADDNKLNEIAKMNDPVQCNVIYNNELGNEIIIGEICYNGEILTPKVEKYSNFDNIVKTIYNQSEDWKAKLQGIKTQADFARLIEYEFFSALANNTDKGIESFNIETGSYKSISKYKPIQVITYEPESISIEPVEPVYNQTSARESLKQSLLSMAENNLNNY